VHIRDIHKSHLGLNIFMIKTILLLRVHILMAMSLFHLPSMTRGGTGAS
jgi:hypothetical protein